jgi:hypothetical protein
MVIGAEHHSATPHISTAARRPIGLKPMQSTRPDRGVAAATGYVESVMRSVSRSMKNHGRRAS